MQFIEEQVKSGMVAIVGPPNAGKSTLMNCFLGQKISIVTPKPQTTRNRIAGIVNEKSHQIVFLDTPGLHRSDEPLNVEMVRVAMESLTEVELVLFLVDVTKQQKLVKDSKRVQELQGYFSKLSCPAILVLNKVDLLERNKVLPLIEQYSQFYPFQAIIPVSALKGEGTKILMDEILKRIPIGPRYFPEDIPTDATERFLCAEIIREQVFLQTGQEIPYSSAVLIESFKEDAARNSVLIHAAIVLERKSQKGIVIGKGGSKLKAIGTAARREIETLVDAKVVLKLWVKVREKWSQDQRFLRQLNLQNPDA